MNLVQDDHGESIQCVVSRIDHVAEPLGGHHHYRGIRIDRIVAGEHERRALPLEAVEPIPEQGPGLGVRRVSLNFAVFRAALERGERIGAGPVLRLWRRFLIFISRWFQIESLLTFNAKFGPRWVPRHVVYRALGDLPAVAAAAAGAEGFTPLTMLQT